MDPRVEHAIEATRQGLQRHWVALAGVAVAALMGGGAGQALSPSNLFHERPGTQLISGPPSEQADLTLQTWPSGRIPDYVIGTDMIYKPQEVAPLPATDAAYAELERISIPTAEEAAQAAEATAHEIAVEYGQAFSAEHAASNEVVESYPALAPG